MKQIEDEEDSLYHKVFLDYRFGLEGPYPIYDKSQIEHAKKSPELGRDTAVFTVEFSGTRSPCIQSRKPSS